MRDLGRRLLWALLCAASAIAPVPALATPTWWFQDPNYPGDRNVGTYVALGGQPSYTWYDDDVPWGTGSVVRLPEDAHYLGDVLSCVACYGGGTATMHSPYFVGKDGAVFFFNHLETIYLGGAGWYNGGMVVGLTGGGTCQTGYGTFCNSGAVVSTGPHFCIETGNQHPDVDFPPTYNPTSSCSYSNGTSGMANILCSVPASCAQYACGSTYYWTCQSDGNLHECDSAGNAVVTQCSNGCHVNPMCTNDVCNPPPPDAGLSHPDAGAETDAGVHEDSGTHVDAGKGADAADVVPDAGEIPDGSADDLPGLQGQGCGYRGGDAGLTAILLVSLVLLRPSRRRSGRD